MSRYRLLLAAIIAAALLFLGYVFLVTGGPEQVEDGISAQEAAGDAEDAAPD